MRFSALAKLGLLLITALVALGLRFFWLTPGRMGYLVLHWAYWVLLATTVAFAWHLYKTDHYRLAGKWLARQRWVLMILVAIWALSLVHERFLFKVNYDEHVLLSISRSMHYQHIAGWQADGKLFYGSVTGLSYVADKRPVFYPFLLSLIHSVSGYRTSNAFVLNGLIAGVALLCTFKLGSNLSGRTGGLLFSILLAGVPLFAQNATSGAFDLLNMTLIGLLAVGVWRYFAESSERNLIFVSFVAIFLANTRYESLLYASVPFLCAMLTSIRDRRLIELPWMMVLMPLAILPALLSNGVFSSSEAFFQTTRDEFWNIKNYAPNLEHAVAYLFDPDRGGTNSLLLAFGGIFSLVCLPIVLRREFARRKGLGVGSLTLGTVGVILVANVVIILGLGWGEWDDPLVSRFTLPFWFLLAWVVIHLFASLPPLTAEKYLRAGAVVSGLWLVVFAASDASASRATNKLGPAFLLARSIEFIKQYDPWRQTLIIGGSALPYLNEGYPAITFESGSKIVPLINYKLYESVVAILHYKRNSTDGSWMGDATMAAFEGAKFQTLKEFHLDPFNRIVIAKVLSVPDEKTPAWIPSSDDEDSDAYARRVYRMLP